MNLILFDHTELTGTGGILLRCDERAVHLLKILRKQAGDAFEAGVLDGRLGTGVIEETGAEGLRFSLALDREPPPRTPLRLAVGFPRPIQLKRLLRDCANLGLTAVDLVPAELGEKSYRDTNLLHDGGARAALIEGAVQARDTRLPQIAVYPSIAAWLDGRPWEMRLSGTDRDDPLLIAADNVRPQGSFADVDVAGRCGAEPRRGGSVKPAGFEAKGETSSSFIKAVVAIGCERGWSDRERDMLEDAGFRRLSLGSRALRTETACVAAVALVMEKLGLLSDSAACSYN
jgi:RsmE family RNA methyltransferase